MIPICIPSYKRPKVKTLEYIPSAIVYIAKSQEKEYREANPEANIVAVNDSFQGNVCRIRNKILDDFRDQVVCIVDDDMSYIGYFENSSIHKLQTENEIYSFLDRYTLMAEDIGAKLWGINLNPDKQTYHAKRPFSTIAYIGSPFMVHVKSPLRFDERFPLKEDYDLSLQHLNRFRVNLRVNKYHYVVKQKQQVGGVAQYRSLQEEKRQLALLQQKWGSHIVREDSYKSGNAKGSKKKLNFDINPKLSIPIKGV